MYALDFVTVAYCNCSFGTRLHCVILAFLAKQNGDGLNSRSFLLVSVSGWRAATALVCCITFAVLSLAAMNSERVCFAA